MKNENLVTARKQKKLSQQQLAEMIGYKGKQAVSNWENGVSTPPINIAILVSKILEKDISFLFGYKVQETHTD